MTEAPAGVTVTPAAGGPLNDSTTLTNTITNSNDQWQLVRFIITPYTRNAGDEGEKCTGVNDTAYVWVEPTARVTATPQQDTICNGDPVSILLKSPTVPTRPVQFRYVTEAPAGVTVTPATGGPLNDSTTLTNTITNSNDQWQLVRFIITPYTRNAGDEGEKCTGVNDTAYVWVEPTARVTATPQQDTICNGDPVSILLKSPTVPTRPVQFRYVTEAPAGVTVTPATGGPLNDSTTLTNTITNSNDQWQLVRFIITPYTRNAGDEGEKCTGVNDTAYVWVEPTARVTATPQQDTICNGDPVSILLKSPTVPTRPVQFRYVTEAPAGVTVTPAAGGPLNDSTTLTNTITNSNDQWQLVRFIITPYTRNAGDEGEKCTGVNDTAYVWVEPTARVTATPQQDTICNGDPVSILLKSPTVPTRPVQFRYVTEAPAGVTVTPATGGPLNDSTTLTNTITNSNDQWQLVRFIITPYTRNAGDEGEKCTGVNDTAYVWVEPTARVTATPQQDTICNGDPVSILLKSPTVPTRPVQFRYVTEAPAGVTVTPATGGPLNDSTTLTNTITNSNDQWQLVRFIITPYTRNAGDEGEKCTGVNDTAYVWVEPTARVTATPQQDTICNGDPVSILLKSPTVPTRPVQFRYVTEAPAGVTVTPATGGPLNDSTTLTNTITNSNDQWQLVRFIITPYTRNAGDEGEKCTGVNDTAYVWVEPTARVTATPQQDTICNGDPVSILLKSPTVPTRPVQFRYVTEAPAGVTVTPATGGPLNDSTTLTNTITNSNDQWQLVRFIITPYTRNAGDEGEKCTGVNDTAYVWVEPTARVTATPQQDTICNGDPVSILLKSPTVPTRPVQFRYVTEAPAGVTVTPATGGPLNDSTTLTNTITNSNDQWQLVRFIITPYTRNAGDEGEKCTGVNDTAYVWVEPTARVTATPQQDTICNGDPVSILLKSPTVPTRPVQFRYVTEAPAGVTVTPATGGPLNDSTTLTNTITNSNDQWQLVRFIITPYTRNAGDEGEKCTGVNDTAYVWVEPTAKVNLTPLLDTICTSFRSSITTSSITQSLQPVRLYYEAEFSAADVEVFFKQDTFDLVPGIVLVDSIVNHSDIPQRVTFIVYPYLRGLSGERKCTGIPDTSYVWVAPELRLAFDSISTFIGGRNISCFGFNTGSIWMQPVGGITAFSGYSANNLEYYLNGVKRSKDIADLYAGNYNIIIRDKLQCVDDTVIVLTQPARLQSQILVLDTLSCFGNDGTIAPLTTGGTPIYKYIWKPATDYFLDYPTYQDTLFNVLDGIYELQIYDTNGCYAFTDILLSQPVAVSFPVFPFNESGPYQIRCYGENSGTIITQNIQGTMIEYSWKVPTDMILPIPIITELISCTTCMPAAIPFVIQMLTDATASSSRI